MPKKKIVKRVKIYPTKFNSYESICKNLQKGGDVQNISRKSHLQKPVPEKYRSVSKNDTLQSHVSEKAICKSLCHNKDMYKNLSLKVPIKIDAWKW